jgi:transcription initiation factor TFIIIB Brf1 subunit/transcription initiation factor TFIIB
MITDSNGYQQTKNSISKLIVHYIESLKIETNEKELLQESMKFLD